MQYDQQILNQDNIINNAIGRSISETKVIPIIFSVEY